jgi:protein TonB
MTRERLFGWVSSVSLQLLALGALGVSPYLSYSDLPEPHNATPIRDYVPVIETPRLPVAPPKPTSATIRPSIPSAGEFVAPRAIPVEILAETTLFEGTTEGVPGGVPPELAGAPKDLPRPGIQEAPPSPGPIRVGGSVTAPRKRHHVNPLYPPIAAAARVQGTVVLEATIDENGNVVNLTVLRSVPLLDGAALEAVRQWEYEPTLLNGSPVPILMTVSVRFELGR